MNKKVGFDFTLLSATQLDLLISALEKEFDKYNNVNNKSRPTIDINSQNIVKLKK